MFTYSHILHNMIKKVYLGQASYQQLTLCGNMRARWELDHMLHSSNSSLLVYSMNPTVYNISGVTKNVLQFFPSNI